MPWKITKLKQICRFFLKSTKKMSNERLPIPVLFLTLFWLDFSIWFQTYLTVSTTCCLPIFI